MQAGYLLPVARQVALRFIAVALPSPHPQEGPGLSSVDLQAVFARMAAARSTTKPSALRFLAAYTDGGTDGGEDELHYWAE
jgi:hypothetical protein